MVTDPQNPFTVWLSSVCVTNCSLKIPTHLKRVATLSYETLVLKIIDTLLCRRKFEPGDKVTFSTKEHWCKTCIAEADRTSPASPSSPDSKKPSSPLTVSPPKPPRASEAVVAGGQGLTPSTDKSLWCQFCVSVISKVAFVNLSVIEFVQSP